MVELLRTLATDHFWSIWGLIAVVALVAVLTGQIEGWGWRYRGCLHPQPDEHEPDRSRDDGHANT